MADDYTPGSLVRWIRLGHAHLMVKTGSVEVESLDLDSMLLWAMIPAEFVKESPAVFAVLDEQVSIV